MLNISECSLARQRRANPKIYIILVREKQVSNKSV